MILEMIDVTVGCRHCRRAAVVSSFHNNSAVPFLSLSSHDIDDHVGQVYYGCSDEKVVVLGEVWQN